MVELKVLAGFITITLGRLLIQPDWAVASALILLVVAYLGISDLKSRKPIEKNLDIARLDSLEKELKSLKSALSLRQ